MTRASGFFFAGSRPEDAPLHLVDAPSHVLSLEPVEAPATMLDIPMVLRPTGTASDDLT